MIRNLIKISKYSRMNGSNLYFCLLNNLFNFVPSSPRFITYNTYYIIHTMNMNRFLFHIGFIEESTSSRLPYLTVRHVRCQLACLYFFSMFPSPVLFSPGPDHSWEPDHLFAFIRHLRAAICHAQIQEFAPRTAVDLGQKKRTHMMLFLISI